MFQNKKVVVVMPAYNAAKTIRTVYDEVLAQGVADHIIIVDDRSNDETAAIAKTLTMAELLVHSKNMGYGANQKTCYKCAIGNGADIVVMIHPDSQYTAKLLPAMVTLIGNGLYDCVLGSRILGGYALKNGMPIWRYISNRCLTYIENILMNSKLSEFHTGYRAFSRRLLESIPYEANADGFIFDNQMLAQVLWAGYQIGEISCPCRYDEDSSSLNLVGCIRYGVGCLSVALQYWLSKHGIMRSSLLLAPRP